MSLTGLVDGSGWESVKVDLGATRAETYSVMAAFEFAATPTTGATVNLFWAPSPQATAGNGNPAQIDGLDAAAPSGIGTLAELLKQAIQIKPFVCSDDTTSEGVQVGSVGTFAPPERYGILIVENRSDANFHSDDVEMHITFDPIIPQFQAE
jgi:hypothetical protein